MTTENMTTEKRVWLRGKPVRGFFGGLLFGLGVALVAHAFKIVPFDDSMFTYFPLGSAVLFALRCRRASTAPRARRRGIRRREPDVGSPVG
ncbi:MAG: hypothetical protein JJE05_06175 [Actinobacteria bacterium]|nr:hypothetical protein [Actinomycetota bacterium]